MFGAPLRYVFSRVLGVDDSKSDPVIAPAEISVPIDLEAEMETKFGKVFVQRKVSENRESFVLRVSTPTRFRYLDENLVLKPGEEAVLYFQHK
jgi:hypothetical protein